MEPHVQKRSLQTAYAKPRGIARRYRTAVPLVKL